MELNSVFSTYGYRNILGHQISEQFCAALLFLWCRWLSVSQHQTSSSSLWRETNYTRAHKEMLKLAHPRRCSLVQTLKLSFHQQLFHSHPEEEDIYDPPFSPISKPSRPTKKSHKPSIVTLDSPKDENLPFHSDLPFDFRYSYSETNPSVKPIGFREPPRFSPFGPGRLDRKWTGTSALVEEDKTVDMEKFLEERKLVLGEPLTEDEINDLVERYRHSDCNRQINLGKGGVTHNLLDDIHNHWKRAEAVRIKCLGVPTLDMDNVCFHLEDKSGGRVIYRNINILLLYRGRNYDPSNRPVIPLMLWKPLAPIYPKLVKNIADGLTFEETKEMRNKGLNAPPLMKLTRNGVYVNVVARVRDAFKTEEVVRLDCAHVDTSDCKKIGVKLKELVPCVPILFKDSQIIIWRGKDLDMIREKKNDSVQE